MIKWLPFLGKLEMNRAFIEKHINTEKEIEMYKILYEFIVNNSHMFSKKVLEAAQPLLREINKIENKNI